MRVTQDLLYDSEATLRLVDRVLEDLDMSDRFRSPMGEAGYRTEQLRAGPVESDDASTQFLRAYWEVQDALDVLRDSYAALQPPTGEAERSEDEHDRLNRALAMVDQLRSEDDDPGRERAHEALREELLALAGRLRSWDTVTDRLHLTADLLLDLERRLSQLSRVLDAGQPGSPM